MNNESQAAKVVCAILGHIHAIDRGNDLYTISTTCHRCGFDRGHRHFSIFHFCNKVRERNHPYDGPWPMTPEEKADRVACVVLGHAWDSLTSRFCERCGEDLGASQYEKMQLLLQDWDDVFNGR